jgi:hypothetical protein
MTDASLRALSVLRSAEHFQWHVIPLLAFVLYVYVAEAQKRNWRIVLAGLLLWVAEFDWEILNALLLKITGYAPLWSTPGDSAYVILVGLNIEICMMFAVAGVVALKCLPEDRALRVRGVPARLIVPLAWGLFCVFVETLLNQAGALVWDWPFWNWPNVYLIVVGYTAPFGAIVWVHDRLSVRAIAIALAAWTAADALQWLVFATWLRWI